LQIKIEKFHLDILKLDISIFPYWKEKSNWIRRNTKAPKRKEIKQTLNYSNCNGLI